MSYAVRLPAQSKSRTETAPGKMTQKEIEKKLKAEANARELSRADIVREALREYFDRREPKRRATKGMKLAVASEEQK